MNPRIFVRPLLVSGLCWIAIAEVLSRDFFLGANTLAAALYVLLEPWLRFVETDPNATVDLAPPSTSNHGSAFVAGAVATSREH